MFNFGGIIAAAIPIPQSVIDASTNPVAKFLGVGQPGSGSDVVNFYQAWAQYLDAKALVWVKVVGGFCAFLAKALYSIAHVVETVFYNLFNLFDILKISEITGNGRFAKLHMVLLLIACALLLISLAVIFISMMMGNRQALHELATTIFTGLIVIVMLPAAVGWLGSFGQAAISDVNAASTSKKEAVNSVSLAPFTDNTVDMLELANDKFNTDPTKIGGDEGAAKYNDLTDDNLFSTSFTDVVAGDNISALTDEKLGNVFKYRLQSGVKDGEKVKQNLVDLNFPAKQFKITQAMDAVYPRFVVNWWLVDLEEIVLTVIFALMAVKVGKSIFEIIMLTLAAPVVSFGNLKSTKQIKALIMTMVGSVMGIVMEVVSVKLFLIVINYLPQSSVMTNLSSDLGGGWAKGLTTLVVYISAFFAMFTGVSFVERWLGTSSGTNQEGRNLLSTFIAGRTMGKMAGGIASTGHNLGGRVKAALTQDSTSEDQSSNEGQNVLNSDKKTEKDASSTGDDSVNAATEDRGVQDHENGGGSSDDDISDSVLNPSGEGTLNANAANTLYEADDVSNSDSANSGSADGESNGRDSGLEDESFDTGADRYGRLNDNQSAVADSWNGFDGSRSTIDTSEQPNFGSDGGTEVVNEDSDKNHSNSEHPSIADLGSADGSTFGTVGQGGTGVTNGAENFTNYDGNSPMMKPANRQTKTRNGDFSSLSSSSDPQGHRGHYSERNNVSEKHQLNKVTTVHDNSGLKTASTVRPKNPMGSKSKGMENEGESPFSNAHKRLKDLGDIDK